MKAERRHELKTNSLAKSLEGLPQYWREYGSRVLLVVLVAAITFLLVRYWNDKKAREQETISTSLETAHTALRELERAPLELAGGAPASAIAEERERLTQQVDTALAGLVSATKDPKVLSNAYLARGDLYWTLANFPALPGSETQPSLDVPNRDGVLEQARSWYQKVIDQGNAATLDDQFYARVGLAAVAENLRQWDKARDQYNAIANSGSMTPSYKQYATERLAQSSQYETTPLIVPAPPAPPVAPAPPPTTERAVGPIGPIGPMPLRSTTQPAESAPASAPASTQP